MTFEHELLNEETTQEAQEETNTTITDQYDLTNQILKIHTFGTQYTTDYILADYSVNVLEHPLPRFIIDQHDGIVFIENWLLPPKETIQKRFPNQSNTILKILLFRFARIKRLILSPVNGINATSRSYDGSITKHVEKGIVAPGAAEEVQEEKTEKKQNLLQKVMKPDKK